VTLPTYRIFVSSPGDVLTERQRIARVVERLNGEFREVLRLEVVRWEDRFYTADRSFQQQIEESAASDVVLCLLWSRIGTPLPPAAPRRPDGSSYESGTVYEVETALAARKAKGTPDIYVFRKQAEVRFSADDSQLEAERAQYKMLLAFWQRWFADVEGRFHAAFQTFRSTDELEKQVEECLRQWLRDRGLTAGGPIWDWRVEGSPFRGLEPFEAGHQRVFFGRRLAVEACRERLSEAAARGCGFLLVLGASGAGKSSLIRAGLVPRLTSPGTVEGVDLWRRALLRPGGDPFAALAQALFAPDALPELSAGDFATPPDLASLLASNPAAADKPIGRALDRAAAALQAAEAFDRPVAARLLLVIDQLEELFVTPPETQAAFAQLLETLARCGRVWVVVTLRGDRYSGLLALPPLLALKAAGAVFDLPLPGGSEVEEIIRGPVRAAGLRYEQRTPGGPDLGDELRGALQGADALPLLQMTLEALFEERDPATGALTVAAYDRIGGLEGAIAARAEAVFAAQPPAARAELRNLLAALVADVAAEGALVARAAPMQEVASTPARAALVDALVAGRLLVADAEDESRVRVAHEALLRRWPRAADVLLAARRAAQMRKMRRLYAAVVAFAILAVAALGAGWYAMEQRGEALEQQAEAERLAGLAAANEQEATRQKEEAERSAALALTQEAEAKRQSALAETERARAEQHLGVALETLDGLWLDLAQSLRGYDGVSTEMVQRILTQANVLADRLAERVPDSVALSRSRAAMLSEFAITYLSAGDTARARAAAEESLAILRALPQSGPHAADLQRDVSVSLDRYGDTLVAQGDRAGALAAYRENLGAVRAMTAAAPEDEDVRRDLIVALNKVGDMLVALGSRAEARAAYEDAQDVARDLLAADPENALARRDLTVTLNKLAGILVAIGDRPGALKIYKESLATVRALAADDPDNADWRRDISVNLNMVGGLLLAHGDHAGALGAYEESLSIVRALSAADPGNAHWRRDVSVGLSKIGDTREAQGDYAGALAAYNESLEVSRALSSSDPDNAEWRRDLGLALGRVGSALEAGGDHAGALAAYEESRDIARALSGSDPDNADWRRDLTVSLNRVGGILQEQGDGTGALAAYKEALEIARDLSEADPSNAAWRRDVSVSLDLIGDLLSEHGDISGALAAFQEGLEIARALTAADPANVEWRHDLSISLDKVGNVLTETGDEAGALAAHKEGLEVSRALSAADPTNPGWRQDISLSLQKIGELLAARGDHAAALASRRESLEIARTLVAANPEYPTWQRLLAVNLDAIGDTLVAQSDIAGASTSYAEALEIRRALLAADPDNAGRRAELVVGLWKNALLSSDPAPMLGEGLRLLKELNAGGHLSATQQGWIPMFEEQLARTDSR
jgi:tetratricopeptide (TPR) repeat protein